MENPQDLRNQLADRLKISGRCVQVWFQNRRQKWKMQCRAMGMDPPALKHTTKRLQSLHQLLPHASGIDAQNAFAHQHSYQELALARVCALQSTAPPVTHSLFARLSVPHVHHTCSAASSFGAHPMIARCVLADAEAGWRGKFVPIPILHWHSHSHPISVPRKRVTVSRR